MKNLFQNVLSFVLMFTVCFAGTFVFASTIDELDFKVLDAKKS